MAYFQKSRRAFRSGLVRCRSRVMRLSALPDTSPPLVLADWFYLRSRRDFVFANGVDRWDPGDLLSNSNVETLKGKAGNVNPAFFFSGLASRVDRCSHQYMKRLLEWLEKDPENLLLASVVASFFAAGLIFLAIHLTRHPRPKSHQSKIKSIKVVASARG